MRLVDYLIHIYADWIELDKDYEYLIRLQARIIEERGKGALDCVPGCEQGCQELLEHVVDYLPKKYPMLFKPIPDGIFNLVTKRNFTDLSSKTGKDALLVITQ